jgi:ubiquitin-conjugating enzyme E2 I
VCLSILDENKDWKPSIAVRDVLLGLQGLLDQPNCMSPAQQEASQMYERHRAAYTAKIRKQALAMAPPPEED